MLSRPLARVGVAMGGLTLMAGGTGGIMAENYVDTYLAQAIAQDLSISLNRPVKMGAVTHISPTSIRFGRSSIPATETDADAVEIEAIAIQFSLLDGLDDGTVPLTVTLIRPEIFLDQNDSGDWLDTDIDLSSESNFPVRRINFRNASLTLEPSYQPFEIHPRARDYLARRAALNDGTPVTGLEPPAAEVQLQGLNASFTLDDQETVLAFSVQGRAAEGGRLRTEGEVTLDEGRVDADVHVHQLAIAPLGALLPSALLVEAGELDGRIQLVGEPGIPIDLQGTATLTDFAAWAEGEPNPFTDTSGRLTFEGQTIRIEDGAVTYGWIPFDVEGTVHLEDGVNLQAQVASVNAADFMATFDLALPFPATGALKTDNLTVTGAFGQTVFAGTVTDAAPVALDQVEFAAVRTDFTLDKGTDVLTLIGTQFTPATGGQIVGNARVKLGNIDDAVITARAEGLAVDAIAQQYGLALDGTQLGKLAASTQVIITEDDLQTDLSWALTEGDYAAEGAIAVADDRVLLRDTMIQVGQDVLNATGELADGRWQTALTTDGFALASAIPDADGSLKGRVTLAGSLDAMTPADIRAAGDVEVTDVFPVLAEPLQVAFNWTGDRLRINHARTSWFEADGWVDAALVGTEPDITAMNMNLRVQAMDLGTLPINLPLPVAGTTQFSGKLTGTPQSPLLDGQLQLADLAVGAIAFAPDLRGRVRMTPDQTLQLALAGGDDEIRLAGTLDEMAFALQRQDAIVQGQVANDQLQATLQAIPLSLISQMPSLNLSPNSLLAALDGRLSGEVAMDWADEENPKLTAEVAIANPTLGTLPNRLQERHQGDRLTATLHYADNTATFTDGQFQFGDSQLHLTGQASPNALEGHIKIANGDLRDVMTVLRHAPSRLGLPGGVMAFAPQDDAIPSFGTGAVAFLMDDAQRVRGSFTGTVDVRVNPQTENIQAQVGLTGANWRMGALAIDQIRLTNGQLNGAYLNVPDLRLAGLAYGDMASPHTTLTASINTHQQTGRLQIERVPLDLVSQWVNSPVSVGGELGAIARWQQTGTMPTVAGTLSIANPSLGSYSTEAVQVGFSFDDHALQVGQWRVPGNPVGLITTGRIPLRLPYMAAHVDDPVRFVSQTTGIPPAALTPNGSGLSLSRRPSQAFAGDGAETLVLSLGLLQPSFSVADLETLIATESVPDGWNIYLDIADLEPDELKTAVTQEIALDLTMADHLMNSPLGEQFLTFVGRVIQTPSGHANIQALRSALVFSVYDDGRVSVLEFLNNYPHDEVYINLNELDKVLGILENALR